MEVFKRGKWIWYTKDAFADSYGEFYSDFVWKKGATRCYLSVDGDYALYINGALVSNNQYADFEHYKVYDSIDLTPYLKEGKNSFAVEVWHFGETSQKYRKAKAGVIFEVYCDKQVLLKSDESILSRESKTYKNGRKKHISTQLGFSFFYDATKEDGWKKGALNNFSSSVFVEKACSFFIRPNEKMKMGEKVEMQSVVKFHSGRSVLVDLGAECVGFPCLSFASPCQQKITVFYGERLAYSNVERFVGGNDYSFEYIAKSGENNYFNPFLRLGCRYLQLYAEEEIQLKYLGIIPQSYPIEEKPWSCLTEKDREIEKLCRNTLKLCMLEHYVDCPWRE